MYHLFSCYNRFVSIYYATYTLIADHIPTSPLGLRVNCFSTISRNQIRNSRIFKTISYSNSFYTVRGMHNYKHYTSPMRQSVALGGSSNDNSYYQGMDAYQILGVPRNADKKTIKAAYRKGTFHISVVTIIYSSYISEFI